MGEMAEGYSGSDISVVVREAIMEPLRKCQVAKQYLMDKDGMMGPCEDYPNCPHCPMKLEGVFGSEKKQCDRCGAIRMTLYDVETDKLKVPVVVYSDFTKALTKAHSSVAAEELDQFIKWTEEFGQEG
mgnify:CR=1 FL=1